MLIRLVRIVGIETEGRNVKAHSHCTRLRPEVPINQWCRLRNVKVGIISTFMMRQRFI